MDRGTLLLLACLNVVAIAALFQRFGAGDLHDFGGVGSQVAEWFNSIGERVAPAAAAANTVQVLAKRALPTCESTPPSATRDFILFSQRVVLPNGGVGPAAVHVRGGIITEVQEGANLALLAADPSVHILDSVISPGVIDVHVHLNEPGRVEWEGIASGTSAAAAGGITTVVDMPLNSNPVTTSLEQLLIKQALARVSTGAGAAGCRGLGVREAGRYVTGQVSKWVGGVCCVMAAIPREPRAPVPQPFTFRSAAAHELQPGPAVCEDDPIGWAPISARLCVMCRSSPGVNVGHWAGLVPGNAADHALLESLLQHGALGFKAFMSPSGIDDFPNVAAADIAAALPLIKRKGAVLYVHAEVVSPLEHCEDADPTQFATFLGNRPASFEVAAVSLLIQLLDSDTTLAAPGFRLHIAHLAYAGCLPLIQAAQARHPITVETCPQYLNFHSEGVPDGSTLLACMPPIRDLENQELLLAAVADGRIDLVASDHSPAPGSMKQLDTGNFMKAWGGISGVQYLLPATWTPLRQHISLARLTELLSTAPAALAGLSDSKGKIAVGYDADLMVWDPDVLTDTSKESEQHKCKLSPYTGTQLYGKVLMTMVKGLVVFKHGEPLAHSVCGQLIQRP
ncbi:MAG: hypothetical protein WDW38_001262 [Sanguina aurantia]